MTHTSSASKWTVTANWTAPVSASGNVTFRATVLPLISEYYLINVTMAVGCPGACSGRGSCVGGMCRCNPGWLDKDCSVAVMGTQVRFAPSRHLLCRGLPV